MNGILESKFGLFVFLSMVLSLGACGKAKYIPVEKPIPLKSDDVVKDGEASKFFLDTLTPAFVANCSGCHKVGGSGPVTIFDFAKASELGQTGTLISKPRGESHGGGNICRGGAPCDQIEVFLKLLAAPTPNPTPDPTPNPTPNPTPDPTPDPTPSPALDLAKLFQENVLPKVNENCAGCHRASAPSTIFDFEIAVNWVRSGDSPLSSIYIQKPLGIGHGGGKVCASDKVSPCLEILEWATEVRKQGVQANREE